MKKIFTFLTFFLLTFNIHCYAQLSVNTSNDTTYCKDNNSTITISAEAINGSKPYRFKWNTNDTNASITVAPITTNTYIVTVTDSLNNTATNDVIITLNPIPTVALGNDVGICNGKCVTIGPKFPSGNIQYDWSTGHATSPITICPDTTSSYTVTVSNEFGCTASDDISVFISGDLNIDATAADETICYEECTQLFVNGGMNFIWSPNKYISDNTLQDPIVCPSVTTTYTVTGDDGNGCTGTDNVVVNIIECPDTLVSALANYIKKEECFIYPNPARKNITVTFNSIDNINIIEIINSIGQIVYTKPIKILGNSEQLDLSSIQKGIYFIKVQTDNGNFIKKIIKD